MVTLRNVTFARDWSRLVEHRKRTHGQTVILIYEVLQAAKEPLTRREIAKAINRTAAPRFIDILEGIVDTGAIKKTEFVAHNEVIGFKYSLWSEDDHE